MTLQWLASDLATGVVLADLPSLACDWPLRRTIGQYDTGTAHLALDGAPPNWTRATMPGAAVLHCYDDGDPALTLQWSGIVLSRTRNGTQDVVDLSLATGESYLARRYVGDVVYTAQSQASIVADLVARFVADTNGMPLTVQSTGGATARTITYQATDNATVYDRLQALSQLQGGPEWMLTWQWSDSTTILPVLVVADRLGASPVGGLAPAAVFAMPGCLVDATLVEDYTDGKGANTVTTYGTGQGSVTPVSSPQSVALNGRPKFELRYQPTSNVSSTADLNSYAAAAAARLADGARALTLVAALTAPGTPMFGRDWQLGDDIGYSIGGTRAAATTAVSGGTAAAPASSSMSGGTATTPPSGGIVGGRAVAAPVGGAAEIEVVPAFPGGYSGTARAIAVELTDKTVTPILADTEVLP